MRAFLTIFPVAVVTLAAQVTVPDDPLESLVRDSPFLPITGAAPITASGEGGPLEFRSVVFELGEFFFSIYDQSARESKWVTFGETDLPYVVRSYNQEEDILTIDYQGRNLALKLQSAHTAGQITDGTSPAPLPSAGEGGQNAGRSTQSEASAPSSSSGVDAAQSQRLQEMADEIRRRRQQPVQPGN